MWHCFENALVNALCFGQAGDGFANKMSASDKIKLHGREAFGSEKERFSAWPTQTFLPASEFG